MTTSRSFTTRAIIFGSLTALVVVSLFQFREETRRVLAQLPYFPSHYSTASQPQHDAEVLVAPFARIPDSLYPPGVGDWQQRHWMDPSEADWVRLRRCLDRNSCTPNQAKVILVQNMYFRNALRGDVGGEEIWATSTMEAMANLGYTVLHAETTKDLVKIYQYFPDLVKIVIMNDWTTFDCWKDKQGCLRSERNPWGIPGYKIISFYFWPFPRHPLGPRWIISPEPFAMHTRAEIQSNNTYLGYSIEKTCRSTRFMFNKERPSNPPQAWVLAKLMNYFSDPKKDFAWSKEIMDAVADQTGVKFGMAVRFPDDSSDQAMSEEDKQRSPLFLPEPTHYVNHVRLKQEVFMKELAQSRVLLGIGNPLISPTPWNALCLGVPFINVITHWDTRDPKDRSGWRTQHSIAGLLDPPYIYNVHRRDKEELINAVKAALANPIQSFVPERMTLPSIEGRLAAIVDDDWAEEERKLKSWCNKPCGCAEPCDAKQEGLRWP